MLRRAAASAFLVLLLAAAPAAADDIVEIDERLIEAGLSDAYTESLPAETGARIVVDFVSDSGSRAAYEQEAALAAELVWEHLEEQVAAVDVAPTSGVPWLSDELPPAVSFTRADLVEAHGERPAELDQASDAEFGDEALFDVFGLVLVLGVLVVLLVIAALSVAVLVLARRSGTRSAWEPQPVWTGGGFGAGPTSPAPAPPPPAPAGPAGVWQPPNG